MNAVLTHKCRGIHPTGTLRHAKYKFKFSHYSTLTTEVNGRKYALEFPVPNFKRSPFRRVLSFELQDASCDLEFSECAFAHARAQEYLTSIRCTRQVLVRNSSDVHRATFLEE